MRSHILSSEKGQRYSFYDMDDNLIFFSSRSTFPDYVKFMYLKKPKWYILLSEEEKLDHDYYYQYNTKDILSLLRTLLKEDRKLTEIQQHCVDRLFMYFREYEESYIYLYNQKIIDDTIPF